MVTKLYRGKWDKTPCLIISYVLMTELKTFRFFWGRLGGGVITFKERYKKFEKFNEFYRKLTNFTDVSRIY